MKTTYRFVDLVVKFIIAVALAIMCERGNAQRWQDSNRGLYPQSIQSTLNVRNTADRSFYCSSDSGRGYLCIKGCVMEHGVA